MCRGNLVRQAAPAHVKHRVVADLTNTDQIICDAFFIGVHPGLTPAMLDYVEQSFANFLSSLAKAAGLSRGTIYIFHIDS